MNGPGELVDILALTPTNLAIIFLILLLAAIIISFDKRFFAWLAEIVPGRYRYFVLALEPVLRLIIIFIAFVLIVARIIEPTLENVLVLLGALGLGIGFALKDYVSSLVAGVVTLFELPYRPGDWIEVNGTYGEVQSIGMRSAEIVTADDTVVIMPHLKLWDNLILNANDGSQKLQCVVHFYLHPNHDAAQAKNALHDVMLTSPYLRLDLPTKVVVTEEPWGTHYRLRAYPVEPRQQFDFITDLTIRGKAALMELGVEFARPPISASA